MLVVRSFVWRNYDKVLMETEKFSGNLRVIENGLVSGVDRAFKSSNSMFHKFGDRLNPFGKSVNFDIIFLCPPSGILLTGVIDDIKIWCNDNETGSLYFGPLRKRSLSIWLRTILRSPVTIWPHGAYRNSDSQQEQSVGFWEYFLQTCFVIKNFGSNRTGIAKGYAWPPLILRV